MRCSASSRRACTGSPATTRSATASSSASWSAATGAGAPHPRARPAPGAAHLDPRGHPRLGRPRGREPGPAELKDLLAELGLAGKRLGVEWETHGLTAANGMRLAVALDGFADHDRRLAPDLPPAAREVAGRAGLRARGGASSPTRRSTPPSPHTAPGADEGVILARMHDADLRGRRRLSRQPVHHRLRPGGPALPLPVRPAPARSGRTSSPSSSPASTASTMPA